MTSLKFVEEITTHNGQTMVRLICYLLKKPVNPKLISYIHKRFWHKSFELATMFRKLLATYGYEHTESLFKSCGLLDFSNLERKDVIDDYFNLPQMSK